VIIAGATGWGRAELMDLAIEELIADLRTVAAIEAEKAEAIRRATQR